MSGALEKCVPRAEVGRWGAARWQWLTRSVICPRVFRRSDRMSLLAKPFPTEMTTPINLEGNKKMSVEAHRNLLCPAADACLHEAVRRGWNSLTGVPCPTYRVTQLARADA